MQPTAGGMFQYAQCILGALSAIQASEEMDVVVVFGDQQWAPIIEHFNLTSVKLRHWKIGNLIARILMSLFIPMNFSRLISRRMNPVVIQMARLSCDLWIFPAQDELTWQIGGQVVGTTHDLMHRYERGFPEAGNWLRYHLREYRFLNISRASDAVLVDSETGKQHVLDSYAPRPDKINVLPFIAPDYIWAKNVRLDFDSYYKLPAKFYFYPAQFWPHKNHHRLIDALAEARRTCSDMALVLSGGFNREYESVRQKVAESGLTDAVRFVGYVPDSDIARFYSRARGLVMPTFFGPTNIPPLEAMATGCPVLISEAYAMPEQCGNAALYFKPNSVAEMSERMIKLWTDDKLHGRLIARGRLRTEAWGQSQFGQRLKEIITNTLQEQSGNDPSNANDCRIRIGD